MICCMCTLLPSRGSSCYMRRWAILILSKRWSLLPERERWRYGWMPISPKTTPIMTKTPLTTILIHKLTPKINTKTFMALKLIWFADSFSLSKRTLMNMSIWMSHNISSSLNIYKAKIFLTNFHFSIHSKNCTVTLSKIIFIVREGWSQYLSCSHLIKIMRNPQIIRWVMWMRSLHNTWLN